MRPPMNPYGRRPDPRTVPLDTALALQEQAKSALQELERIRWTHGCHGITSYGNRLISMASCQTLRTGTAAAPSMVPGW